jgi:hypothetical protein
MAEKAMLNGVSKWPRPRPALLTHQQGTVGHVHAILAHYT